MKRSIFILIGGMFLSGGLAWSRPVDLSAPGTELGSAGQKGYLEVWKEVDGLGLQLGSSYLPFRYKVTSDPSVTGGGFGPGYYIPMFSARSTMVRERVMKANLPCGKVLYFWQDAYDPAKFQTPDKEWTGIVHDQDFIVSRDDGWKIDFFQGRLQSVTDDQSHVFKWNYQGELPASIEKDGATVLTVQPNGSGLIGSIVEGAKSYEVGYGKRPITEIVNGIVLIKDLPMALSSFKTPDGKTDSFSFDLSQDRVPGLTVTDSGGQATSYTWNPTNNYIASEDGPGGKWKYTVGQVTQEFGVPPLSRTRSDGKTEGISVDTKQGIYTVLGADGVKTVTQVFESPGPLYQKVKSIQQISGGVTNTIMKASYDEAGKMIRKVGSDGFVTRFFYNAQGKQTNQITELGNDPVILGRLKKAEQDLLEGVAKASNKDDALQDLASFYLFQMKNPAKATALLPQLSHRNAYFIRAQLIDNNENFTARQKIAPYQSLLKEYPEYQEQLNSLIKANTAIAEHEKDG